MYTCRYVTFDNLQIMLVLFALSKEDLEFVDPSRPPFSFHFYPEHVNRNKSVEGPTNYKDYREIKETHKS